MTAIILAWDPEHWNRWNYPAAVDRVAVAGLHMEPWDVGRHRNIRSGTEAWLLLQGRHGRGLIGHGVVVSAQPEPEPLYAGPDGTARPVIVAFDALLSLGDQIGDQIGDPLGDRLPDQLDVGVPEESVAEGHPDGTHGPVLTVGPSEEARIRALWTEFGRPPGPDPTQPAPGTYPEGALTRVPINRYERSPEARRACIAHHGTGCAACGFSFEISYGAIGKDFIHVHHIVPVSQLGGGYELDPVTDLVPLCANCHAMAHQGVSTPRTVAELRRIIAGAGFLAGATVTPEELDAEREARRMLGP
ncbi:HNH endonuclease [Pseudarthrobacter sp. H2]|uniref:HNH endonuclease n=1 Tax=Pseudarthrobacter sp. H2 TaxID=3418415 RepID=UPI003CF6CA8D